MDHSDVEPALDIIAAHDADDAEAAEASYDRSLDGQFIMTAEGQVVGVTGVRPIPATDGSFRLSWCYLDAVNTPTDVDGEHLLDWLVQQLRQHEARKLFVEVSQMDAPLGGGRRYGGAGRMYEDYGFAVECHHRDYYMRGEDMTVLGYRIDPQRHDEPVEEDARFIAVVDADEILETDDAYYIDWDYVDEGMGSSAEQIRQWIDRIAGWDARCAFVGVPSHATVAQGQLLEVGFTEDGRLTDLICDGIDEIRYRLDF